MADKSPGAGRQQYEALAEELAAPIAEGSGTRIYDVEYVREGQEYYLNVYIDKDGGVTIDDCEAVSRSLSDALDEADFIRDPYTLVVSSPGLGRALTRDRHLAQSVGQEVEVHLYSPHPVSGEKDLRGELADFDEEHLVLLLDKPLQAPVKKGAAKKGTAKKGAKGKKKKPGEKPGAAAMAQAAADAPGQAEGGPGPADGHEDPGAGDGTRLVIDRKAAASIRLAFDF